MYAGILNHCREKNEGGENCFCNYLFVQGIVEAVVKELGMVFHIRVLK